MLLWPHLPFNERVEASLPLDAHEHYPRHPTITYLLNVDAHKGLQTRSAEQ
jgi:hypothetical protein